MSVVCILIPKLSLQLALRECQPDALDRERMRGMIDEWQTQITARQTIATSVNRQNGSSN